jgi:hypothetical protein
MPLYTPPIGPKVELADTCELKHAVLDLSQAYWHRGSGGGSIEIVHGDGTVIQLLILPNLTRGIYLKYLVRSGALVVDTWLSLADPSMLGIVDTCGEDWYASSGLFLGPEISWQVIEDFLHTGVRSRRISWIQPSELPDKGNW